VIGAFTLIGQGQLLDAWKSLANSGGSWLIGAFFLGVFMPSWRWAASAGLLALLACLVGY